MKKTIPVLWLVLLLLLPGCARKKQEPRLSIVCTTYPIYLLVSSLTEGVEGVAAERLDPSSGGCLHDYTLTVADMKKLDRADIIALNGAGLEEFLEAALETSDAVVIDCSMGVDLLENLSHDHDGDDHDGHDHGHWDPHYWMDPANARIMAANLRNQLVLADPHYAEVYETNTRNADMTLLSCQTTIENLMMEFRPQMGTYPGLITFHDGFQYFARACGLPLLASIEEEAGSEASAREIVEISALVKAYNIPIIFTEINGSDATANAIARETGCQVAQLSMLMDGPDEADSAFGLLENYSNLYHDNLETMINGFAGERVVPLG